MLFFISPTQPSSPTRLQALQISHIHRLYALLKGRKSIVQFGEHPGMDNALLFQLRVASGMNVFNHTGIIFRIHQNARFFKAVEQLHFVTRRHSYGNAGSDGVRIGIQQLPLLIVGDGAAYRGKTSLQQRLKTSGVDSVDVACEAVVDLSDDALVRPDEVAIGATQAQGVAVFSLELGYQLLVDQSGVDHRYHFQGSGIGDPATIDHFGFLAHFLEQVTGFAATAVYQNGRASETGKKRKGLVQCQRVGQNITANFEDT